MYLTKRKANLKDVRLHPLTQRCSRSSCTDSSLRCQSREILRNPLMRPETSVCVPSEPQCCRCQRCKRWYARHCPSLSPIGGAETRLITRLLWKQSRFDTQEEVNQHTNDLLTCVSAFSTLTALVEINRSTSVII